MILKSVYLNNFRQFVDEKIEFSLDKDHNITLVRGENSSGKTTLANAITWCLFADAKLDGTLINKLVWQNAKLHEKLTVKVEIELIHAEDEYTITTTQDYQIVQGISANAKNRPQPIGGIVRKISYKGVSTQWVKEEVPKEKIENTIQKIVPQELSEYFFIKAEQMRDMEQGVSKGDGRSFEKAVKRILGFDAIENAIKHSAEAIRVLNSRLELGADEKVKKLQDNIDWYEKQIATCKENIRKYREDIEEHDKEIKDMENRIKDGAEGEQDQLKLERVQQDFKSYSKYLVNAEATLFSDFSEYFVSNCYQEFLPTLLTKLESVDLKGRDIPDATATTIKWILDQKECICGRKFEEGDDVWEAISSWIKTLPPENLGNCASRFIENIESRQEKVFDLKAEYNKYIENKEEWERKKDDAKQEIKRLSERLKSYQSTKDFQERKMRAESDKRSKESSIKSFERKIAEEFEPRMRKDKQALDKFAQANDRNQLIKRRGVALTTIYKHFKNFNEKQKNGLNIILNNKVNEFFSSVFSNDYKISISDKYLIRLVDNDGEIVGAGGAQSVSVVLAFITSLLKLSQQIHYGKLDEIEDKDLLKAEPYPLVLDAPFSTFDEERIKSVAPKLSDLTEQVIIFTKDPECGILTDIIMDKVGKYYTLKSATRNEKDEKEVWSTHIEGGNNAN